MDLVPLLTYGYCPRFGDSRDAGRTARCHSGVVGCQVKLFVVSNLQASETYFQTFRAFEISQRGRYHKGDEVVIVQWRRKLGQETFKTSQLNVPFPFNCQCFNDYIVSIPQYWKEQFCRNNQRHMHRLFNQQPIHGRRLSILHDFMEVL